MDRAGRARDVEQMAEPESDTLLSVAQAASPKQSPEVSRVGVGAPQADNPRTSTSEQHESVRGGMASGPR